MFLLKKSLSLSTWLHKKQVIWGYSESLSPRKEISKPMIILIHIFDIFTFLDYYLEYDQEYYKNNNQDLPPIEEICITHSGPIYKDIIYTALTLEGNICLDQICFGCVNSNYRSPPFSWEFHIHYNKEKSSDG